MRKTLHLMLLLFACFCSLAPAALAGPAEEMAAFFRPAIGVVIMQTGDEYLIDLDAAKGVRVGDLLAVIVPGEKVVHPATGQVLGSLDALKGVFQVTRVKSGYSYIRPVGKAETITRGDTVRSWEQVPAAFRTEQGGVDALGGQLQAALPQLDWRSETPDVPLVFIATPERLEVRGPDGAVLNSVSLSPVSGLRNTDNSIASVVPAPSAAIVTAPPSEKATAIVRNQQTATDGLWMSPEFSGEMVGVHVADCDGDGQQEVVTAFPYRLEVGRITGGVYTRLASLDLGFGQKVLTLDGTDLDGNGREELYLTAANNGELQSLAVTLDAGQLKIAQNRLPWYLRSVKLPGEGRVLLGQRMGRLDEDFAGSIFRISWQNGTLAEGTPLHVPQGIKLFGFIPIPGNNETATFIQLNPFDELKVIDSEGATIWKSEEKSGGSEAYFERVDPTKNPAQGPATRSVFVQQRLEIENGSFLIPANEGQRILARVRSFDKSSLRAMTWNGFALQELWHTQPQNGYLADFRLADADNDGHAEIVQALVFSRDGLMSKGRSALALFELQP